MGKILPIFTWGGFLTKMENIGFQFQAGLHLGDNTAFSALFGSSSKLERQKPYATRRNRLQKNMTWSEATQQGSAMIGL